MGEGAVAESLLHRIASRPPPSRPDRPISRASAGRRGGGPTATMNGGGGGGTDAAAAAAAAEVEWARCECCGLTEECTPAYASKVRERHLGRWICGLCAEAVKDEIGRSRRPISTAEAIDRHAGFFRAFRAVAPRPDDAAEHLVAAIARLLRRTLDSPRAAAARLPSTAADDGAAAAAASAAPENPRTAFARSRSCFASLQS